jgi:anti-anti-sigma factor
VHGFSSGKPFFNNIIASGWGKRPFVTIEEICGIDFYRTSLKNDTLNNFAIKILKENRVEISIRNVGEVTVVDISGMLDTNTSGVASDEMGKVAGTSDKLLLNLENLEFLSSAGLRVFLRTAKLQKGSGGAIKVCGATGVVQEVMEISGFGSLLDLHDSESDALAAF